MSNPFLTILRESFNTISEIQRATHISRRHFCKKMKTSNNNFWDNLGQYEFENNNVSNPVQYSLNNDSAEFHV